MADQRHIGLFFGSFNPIHTGHLIISCLVLEALNLDELWLVISPQNPFKLQGDLASEKYRVKMAKDACKAHSRLFVSDIELALPKPSYTIQTLDALQLQYPDVRFSLIIGEDNLTRFHEWKDIDRILNLVQVAVYGRSVSKYPAHPVWKGKVHFLDLPMVDISATNIRERVQLGLPITYLVHPSTERFILKKQLYL
jgi:nicotinate-nucleotide adenylyltransferase